MDAVYVVQHVHIINDDEEDVKMVGVYSTKELGREAVERLRLQPGFCDVPDGFHVDKYELNKDHWDEGFVTVYPNDLGNTGQSGD